MRGSLLAIAIASLCAIAPLTAMPGIGAPSAFAGTGHCTTSERGTHRSDRLKGTPANNLITAGFGNDSIKSYGGGDCIFGGPDNDRLRGGPGRDHLRPGAGNDSVRAVDGERDIVHCGPGRHDRARVDPRDKTRNCERVAKRRPKRSDGGGDDGGGDGGGGDDPLACEPNPDVPAECAAPREFFGISPTIPTVAAGDYARMDQAKVGTFRFTIHWSTVQRTDGGPFTWTKPDVLMSQATAAGMYVLPFLAGSPEFATGTMNDPPVNTEKARQGWSRFVTAVVERYGRGGSFWSQHPELPYNPIEEWEIWNEENLPAYWGGSTPSPTDYATLLTLADQAIHGADPQADVLMGGLSARGGPSGVPPQTFLSQLYDVPGISQHFDDVGVHPYAETPAESLQATRQVRDVMDAHGDAAKGIWATELGWSSEGPVGGLFTTPEGQASNITEVFSRFLEDRQALNLERVIWFTWQDDHATPNCDWCENSGLVAGDDGTKPSLRAFTAYTGGTP
jgi:hypothetical protein